MSLPVFLVDPDALVGATVGTVVVLAGDEGRHAATVRRLRVGESLELSDGAGGRARGMVRGAGAGTLDVEIIALDREPMPSPRLVVVQALAKGDRGELAVELLTEVGVDEIVPWSASRSIVQWRGERAGKSLERWRSTAREAGKQSRRAWLPEVTEPASTDQVCRRLAAAAAAVVLHEDARSPLAAMTVPVAGEVVLVVGPEGGIAPEELAAFESVGARTFRLGPTVMRTSTAGAAACAALLSRTSRWH